MMPAWLPTNSQYHWLVKLFTSIKRNQPERIDKEYIRSIVADNHETSLLKLARFLEVADDNGNRGSNYDKLNDFGGESFKRNLWTIIKIKYSGIFDVINPLSANKERIVEIIISSYKIDNSTARRIIEVFAQFCRLADIRPSFIPTKAKQKKTHIHGQASLNEAGVKSVPKMPIEISEKAKTLLDLIPQDGSSIGNTYLQTISKTGEDYWKIRDELLKASLIEKGKGRGGSVSRTQSILSTLETFVERTADFVKEEKELYDPLKKWLDEQWGKEVEDDGDYYRVRVTATPLGRKRNSGQWSRPDVTFVRATKYDYLPSTIVEVTSFEVKRNTDAKDLASVYEAAAHSRYAHNTYLVAEIPNNEKFDDSVQKECIRLGVGLITVSKTHNKHYFAEMLEPRRQEPAPQDLDKFLKDFFSDDERQQKQFKIRIK
jgi:hypothetical protein